MGYGTTRNKDISQIILFLFQQWPCFLIDKCNCSKCEVIQLLEQGVVQSRMQLTQFHIIHPNERQIIQGQVKLVWHISQKMQLDIKVSYMPVHVNPSYSPSIIYQLDAHSEKKGLI